jgi:glutaredoxin 3
MLGMVEDKEQESLPQRISKSLSEWTASSLMNLENARIQRSSVVDEQGRIGEPMEWSETDSLANRFTEMVSGNPVGYRIKQSIADIVAGSNYNVTEVDQIIDSFISDNGVALFAYATCPFCRRAKDALQEIGVPFQVMELDELPGNQGNEIRARLGRRTKRTSVPHIFIHQQFIGGCNDGSPGLIPLIQSGKLTEMLARK